jgi:hypothetical protein
MSNWIPVSEGLPDGMLDVSYSHKMLITIKQKYGKTIHVGRYHVDTGIWKIGHVPLDQDIVIAWQPLPEPYEGKV